MPEALLLFSDTFLLLEQKLISISFKDSIIRYNYICVSLPTLGLGLLSRCLIFLTCLFSMLRLDYLNIIHCLHISLCVL